MTLNYSPVVMPLGLALLGVALFASSGRTATWDEVQSLKRTYMESCARNAIEQQKTTQAKPVAVPLPESLSAHGETKIVAKSPKSVSLKMTVQPKAYRKPASEFIRIELPQAMNLVDLHSGLAMTVKTGQDTSPEVRIGCRLIGADGKQATILPIVPARSRWGDNPHEVYLDWAFLNYGDAEKAVAVLRQVKTIEITLAAARRAPVRGSSKTAQSASLTISDVRLVDYLKGSYDPSRRWLTFDKGQGKWTAGGKKDLTLQHRCQEVTGIVATFGGDAGRRSAINALDMAARTQCWDGSFLCGRRGAKTVASGEYTFGFTLYGLLGGYMALNAEGESELDAKITVGPMTMTRREACLRMFYRGAMARTAALPSDYRDDIIGGDTLMTGANRVLGYAIAMRMIADVLPDDRRKQEVLAAYRPMMQQIADAQGKYSGGFPVLGEGNKYAGKGIHYDGGYIRTHMDWLVLGVRRTGDPLLVQMLRRYQTVFEAAMNSDGTGLKKLISERHAGGRDVRLILPDATAQVGMKYQMPIIAQWGYNCGIPVWTDWEKKSGNHFTFASHTRGYSLGAHTSILIDDMAAKPKPKDLGYLFPRQYPIWSSRLYNKAGELQRTSRVTIGADGKMSNDFDIKVGEYPVTVGVPIAIKVSRGTVVVTADKLEGWPKLLPDGAEVTISGDVSAKGAIGQPITLVIPGKSHVVITGPEVTLPAEAGGKTVPFRAELTLEPQAEGRQSIELTVLRGTIGYKHTFTAKKAPGGRRR
jgi:hypothetical protein